VKTIDTAAILAFGRVRTMFTYGVHQSSWRIEQPSIALCLPYWGKLRGLHVTPKGSHVFDRSCRGKFSSNARNFVTFLRRSFLR